MPDLSSLATKDIVTLLVIALIALLIALSGFMVYVIAPVIRGKNTDKDAENKQQDGLLQVIRDNQQISAQTVEVLRGLSVTTQANKDALVKVDEHISTAADRNAALIRETHDSVKSLRTDVLAALEKLPDDLKKELAPIADEIKNLAGISETVTEKIALLQKTFVESLQRMATPVSPIPVYVANAAEFATTFKFDRTIPTLAKPKPTVSPIGEKDGAK